jgi:hypothetical protein
MTRARTATVRLALTLAAALAALAAGRAGVAHAASGAPWWRLDSTTAPTNLPSHGEAQIVASASNLGDGELDALGTPATFTDTLPAGVRPVAVESQQDGDDALGSFRGKLSNCTLAQQTVTCEFTKTLAPYERLSMRITVETENPAGALENVLHVEGANAPAASLAKPLHLDPAETTLGVETYALTAEGEEGGLDTQAGSHPFQLTTTLDFDQTLRHYPYANGGVLPEGTYPSAPSALPRNIHIKLPPGLVGDASAVAQCSGSDFSAEAIDGSNLCPSDSAVGVASVVVNLGAVPTTWTKLMVPVFNLEPGYGEPARLGFEVERVPVLLKTAVAPGGEYPVEVTLSDLSQAAQILSSQVTLWGVPGDPRHDSARGWECLGEGHWESGREPPLPCTTTSQPATAFLTLPSSCATPPTSTLQGESWPSGKQQTVSSFQARYQLPSALTGCGVQAFGPSIAVEPEQHSASTPSGLDVDLGFPQDGLLAASGLAESALRETTVTLPAGVQLNPSAANALQACSALDFGSLNAAEAEGGHPLAGPEEEQQTADEHFTTGPPECPGAAKLGTVNLSTPLLRSELTGSLYLAAQNTSPFRSPLALYLVAEDKTAGILVKLAGEVTVDEATGQLTTTFRNTPQLPFSDLHLHLFAGQRASLSTPALCGSYQAETTFTPWSAGAPAHPGAGFQITSGAGGTPCPSSPLPFAPAVSAGTLSTQAGAFTSFTLQIAKPDGQQQLSAITVHMPPGIAGLLAKLTPCPEPPAGQEWSCGPESVIGDTIATAGLGSEPITLPGRAYLTSGYDGAPFGVLVQTPAVAGPFNLGIVNVRSKIEVNHETAAVTITSDPGPRGEGIPTRLKGVPAQLQRVEVNVDRPEFLFNPTSCDPLTITGATSGSEGASTPFSYPFQVTNCATLPFHPTLQASTQGQASKADGASLTVKVTSAGLGQANIQKVFLTIPRILPSRLQPTLQHACLAAVFEANPAACDEDSLIGHATVRTPILKSPLTGPAYVVSHGNAAFPDVEFVLQGEGITLVLDGKSDIKKGVTYSRFESAPDAPFTSFETVLPTGPHSVLAVNTEEAPDYDLCTHKITIPTQITAQDGATLEQTTNVVVTGCATVKPTNAQLLAKALKACKKDKRKTKRAACEKTARKKYAAHSSTKKHARKAATRKQHR